MSEGVSHEHLTMCCHGRQCSGDVAALLKECSPAKGDEYPEHFAGGRCSESLKTYHRDCPRQARAAADDKQATSGKLIIAARLVVDL